jgi:hypothetical protein
LPLLFSAWPGQSFLVLCLVVVRLVVPPVVGLVVGLVVVVVLFVPVPPPVPPPVPVCAKVVAAEAPTRATPRTNAITCFISLILRRRCLDCQRNPALSVPPGGTRLGPPLKPAVRIEQGENNCAGFVGHVARGQGVEQRFEPPQPVAVDNIRPRTVLAMPRKPSGFSSNSHQSSENGSRRTTGIIRASFMVAE